MWDSIFKSSNLQIFKSAACPRFSPAITGRLRTPDQAIYDSRCAADTGFYFYCALRAVHLTGPAFHAQVAVLYVSPFVHYCEDRMGTDNGAHPATVAPFFVKLQCHNIRQVNKTVHGILNVNKK
jgi:hypothetical protein